jgi:hypothetical protein
MIKIDESIVWDKEHVINQALQGNPLWPHHVAVLYNIPTQHLFLSPKCDFPKLTEETKIDYEKCFERKIFHLDIKLIPNLSFDNYKKIFEKIKYGGNSIFLHLSNTNDLKRYLPITSNPLVVPTIDWFNNKFDKLYIELSNKTWNASQFYGFRYVAKANKPNWNKIVRKSKKIKEFAIMEETPKKPNDVNPIAGFKLESTALIFKENNNLVDIFKD